MECVSGAVYDDLDMIEEKVLLGEEEERKGSEWDAGERERKRWPARSENQNQSQWRKRTAARILETAARGTNGRPSIAQPRITKSYLIHLGGSADLSKGRNGTTSAIR